MSEVVVNLRSAARLTVVGLVLNVVMALVKISAGVVGNSYALIADGVESTVDIFSSLVVWGGLRYASRPADANHPYGHGKAESLAALVVASMLLLAAVGIAFQSVREILTPHHAPEPFTLLVLLGVIAVKEGWCRWVLFRNRGTGSRALETDAWHHRSDALTSAAAFIGISIALLGGDGYEAADDWAALFACGVILLNGWWLFRPALGDMLDEAPPPEIETAVRLEALQVDGVVALDKCRVRNSGLDRVVEIHVRVDGSLTVDQGHDIAHAVKDALCASGLRVLDAIVHIEPARPGELRSRPVPDLGPGG